MEKLNKEQLAYQNIIGSDITAVDMRIGFKAGLEYAENHYLKLIEEKR